MTLSATVVHGIPNCDQVRKARRWLQQHAIDYRFHDLRRDGVDAALLGRWLTHVPWDSLVNRRGQTWRGLDAAQRDSVVDQPSAVALMLAHPTVIRRPVVETGERLLVGFHEPLYAEVFGAGTAR